MKAPTFHKYANIFPMIQGAAFDALLEDIRTHGVREPVVFLDGEILDGRNRYKCATELGLSYPRIEYTGTDPLGFVVSHNLHRRHMTESQRAMVAAALANMPANTGVAANLQSLTSRADAAKLLKVSERSVNTAKKVLREGSPELIDAVQQGKVSVSAAADIATLPANEQAAISLLSEKAILEAAKDIRTERANKKRAIRNAGAVSPLSS